MNIKQKNKTKKHIPLTDTRSWHEALCWCACLLQPRTRRWSSGESEKWPSLLLLVLC